ncbi:MAG: 23S rRNA (pseudouridine(1915)-N(3))-methyltransferase RlmH, partial [Sinobacterium sp.]|nr:23S rRNA (pseudouridine(1915)-N(3))-methyltransferase RlmH [Sinobacterium sp.]
MKIRLLCIGQKMPSWVTQAYDEFAKRVNGDCKIELVELPMAKRSKNSCVAQMKEKEAQTIFA